MGMDQANWRILLIDDDRDDYFMVGTMLAGARQAKFLLDWASTCPAGIEALKNKTYDIVLVDYDLGVYVGLDLIREFGKSGYKAPMILLTGRGSYEVDLEAMQAGAADYLNKNDLNAALLERSIRFAIERRHSEDALRESQSYLQLTTEAGQIGLWDWDNISGAVTWDSRCRALFGLPEDALVTEEVFLQAIHPDDRGDLIDQLLAYVYSGEQFEVEFRVLLPNGTIRWVFERGRSILDASGQPIRTSGVALDITEQRAMQEAIQLSERRFRGTFENAAVGIAHVALDGRFELVNQRLCAITGYLREELIQKTFQEITFPEDLEKDLVQANRLASGEIAHYTIEKRYIRKDGTIVWINLTGSAQIGPSGQIEGFIAVIEDISERKQLEMTVRESEAALRGLFESDALFAGLLEVGPDDVIFSVVNSKLAAFYGHTPETMAGKTAREVGLFDQATARAMFEQCRASGKLLSIEYPLVYKGKQGWYHGTLSLIPSQPNHSPRFAFVAVDITERKQAEMELRESEQRFHIALQNAPIVVFTQDAALRYTWVHNPRAGFHHSQVLGKRDDELLEPEAAAILTAPKRFVLQSGQSMRQEVTYRIGDQTVVYDLTLEPLRNPNGEIIGLTGAAMDLTDLRRLEQEQIAYAAQMEVQRRLIQQRELERMDIARDLHDGLLQEMTGISFALAEAMSTDEKQARVKRLSWVRDQIQIQSGEIRTFCNELRPPALAPFGLEKAIRAHAEEYQKRHSDLVIHLNLQADHQTLPEEIRMALFRIYQESLNNISKHSKAGQVWISFWLDGEEACLEIEDDGIGFELPRDWVAQARSGHLGLLGMRERVQSIDGEIEFDSRPGQGTRVRVVVSRR